MDSHKSTLLWVLGCIFMWALYKGGVFVGRKEDAIEEFKYIVTNYILPLIRTSGKLRFRDDIPPHRLERLINVYPEQNRLSIYPCLKNPQFHFRINLGDSSPSLGAPESILREIMYASQYNYGKKSFYKIPYYEREIGDLQVYRNGRFDTAYEVGLCNWLGGTSVYRLLDKLQNWSRKTYEGQRMPFSFIIDAANKAKGHKDYIHFLNSNHSAVFTDGMSCGIALDNNGQIINYFSTTDGIINDGLLPLVPYRFCNFAQKCYTDDYDSVWVGIILQNNGDILIFKNRQLVFIKRSGKWLYINPHRIYSTIAKYFHAEDNVKIAKELYLSILDISFSRSGGCIGIVAEKFKQKVKKEYIPRDDLEIDEPDEKKDILRRLIRYGATTEGPLFHTLDRKLRRDLLSLDGATVIDNSGRIMGIGAIVKIGGGSDEGGRTAAAKQLANFGLGIKVSMDGRVQGFCKSDNGQSSVDEIFTLL